MKKNEKFVLLIEDMSEDGSGIGKQDGFIWFVKDALIGDKIEAQAMKMKKTYGFARLVRVIEPAPGRVKARCPIARQCGGCQLQELSYEEQLKFKESKVYNNLKRIGGLAGLRLPAEDGIKDGLESGPAFEMAREMEETAGRQTVHPSITMEPIIGMEKPWRYRNKAQFPIGEGKDGRPVAGFYAGRTHSIIPVPERDCLLGVEENRIILDTILNFMEKYNIPPYNETAHRGLVRHVLIRKGFRTGEIMVCLVINGEELSHVDKLVDALTAAPQVTSLSISVNTEKTNVIMGTRIIHLLGPGYITDYIGDVKYQISPLSFYQVNPVQTERLYGTALEYAGLTGGETVWDLYCGIGTISLFLAKKAGKVFGVEIVPQAIEDARRNAEINGIENVEFFVGKAEDVLLQQYQENHVHADVIVVDPPRKGCDTVCLDTIVRMRPERVVYVSCDSATLARDVKYLGEHGYRVERVRAVDMFGHSGHVETVTLLVRKP